MVHIKDPLLLIKPVPDSGTCTRDRRALQQLALTVHVKHSDLSSPFSGSSGFPLSLSEWSFTICLMPYSHKKCVLSASLNKTFPSFLTYDKEPLRLHFPISSKGSFICTIPQSGQDIPWPLLYQLSMDPPWVVDPTTHCTTSGCSTMELHLTPYCK